MSEYLSFRRGIIFISKLQAEMSNFVSIFVL